MTLAIHNAISTYHKANQTQKSTKTSLLPENPHKIPSNRTFSEFVNQGVKGAVASLENSEKMTHKSLDSNVSLNDLVSSINSAELTLKAVVNVRNKVLQSYQSIIRMPI